MQTASILKAIGFGTSLFFANTAIADTAPNSVALVLDASGSMNGRLTSGERKIVAARSAVEAFVYNINPDTNLALRAYGHQSHRSKKNCKDTQLIVGFGKAGVNADEVATQARGLEAQGYTPITYVLGLAADDLKSAPGKRTIVLVSDGKETCEGDPCLLAQKLAAADASLVIHTIGFGVDATTRRQLQCIADKGKGEYFPADGIDELTQSMTIAVSKAEATPVRVIEKQEVPDTSPGKLEIIGADRHAVLDAETGDEVIRLSYSKTIDAIPPGLYNIEFDNGLWKSVEVRANETTTLAPAILKIVNGYRHEIFDAETGVAVSSVSMTADGGKAVLVPGRFDIGFEDTFWRGIQLEEGKTTILNAASIQIKGAGMSGVPILDSDGEQVAKIRSTRNYASLPPGTYTLVLDDDSQKALTLAEGQTVSLTLK